MIAFYPTETSTQIHNAPCQHGLVSRGQQCPECMWNNLIPIRGRVGSITQAQLKARIEPYLDACRAACPPELLPQLEARIAEGNWYALQFIRRLRRGENLPSARSAGEGPGVRVVISQESAA